VGGGLPHLQCFASPDATAPPNQSKHAAYNCIPHSQTIKLCIVASTKRGTEALQITIMVGIGGGLLGIGVGLGVGLGVVGVGSGVGLTNLGTNLGRGIGGGTGKAGQEELSSGLRGALSETISPR